MIPWYESSRAMNEMRWGSPFHTKYSRASLMPASTASEPDRKQVSSKSVKWLKELSPTRRLKVDLCQLAPGALDQPIL